MNTRAYAPKLYVASRDVLFSRRAFVFVKVANSGGEVRRRCLEPLGCSDEED